MKLLKKFTFLNLLLFFVINGFSQSGASGGDGTDFMTANGKIHVVMAVVVVIVLGLFLYLISLDKKISKLEKGKKE
jgi:hypothetical protein